MNIQLAGEFRCVVSKKDGTVVSDTGYQDNLLLNQGLEFFGGGKGGNIFYRCAVGSGNSAPLVTQTGLDVFITSVAGVEIGSSITYTDEGDNLYKTNKEYRYRFEGMGDVNLSEVGLVSDGTTESNYYLCTRALLKDVDGVPTAISIKSDETLDIYYKFWHIHSLIDGEGTFNLIDGTGATTAYEFKTRLAGVGGTNIGGSGGYDNAIGVPIAFYNGNTGNRITDGEMGDFTQSPLGSGVWSWGGWGYTLPMDAYVPLSNKAVGRINMGISEGVGNLRTLLIMTTMGMFQVRFGSVDGDLPIVKTNKEKLYLPLEVSWSRYVAPEA